MSEIRNKPRVFLSHSKRDVAFVDRLAEDLRRCQIDPWLDDVEIRHGQPWLDAIFESGIPACDCVIVYFTHNSLESPVVRKEVDASLIQKLKDDKILFLPYVCESSIRSNLRADIQALQAPEWNDSNYTEMLPRVVAEVWRGFMERNILASVNAEKVKRLETERELDQLRGQTTGVFSKSEEKDFSYICETLSESRSVLLTHVRGHGDQKVMIEELRLSVRMSSIVPVLARPGYMEHEGSPILRILSNSVRDKLGCSTGKDDHYESADCPDLKEEFLMFGLLERKERPEHDTGSVRMPVYTGRGFRSHTSYRWPYTEKMQRFKYWLAFTNNAARDIEWEVVERTTIP